MEVVKVCECGNEFTEKQSSGKVCFKCKLRSVGFKFVGPFRPTREDFRNHTIREAIAEQDREIRASGGDPSEYESTARWV